MNHLRVAFAPYWQSIQHGCGSSSSATRRVSASGMARVT